MEQQVINATETVIEAAADKGIFTMDNAIKVLAVAGVVTVGVALFKATKNVIDKRQGKKTTATDEKDNTVDVEVENPAA